MDDSRDVRTEPFTLDANGFAASQPLHDPAGNLTYDGRHTFTYDAWNCLTEVRIDDGDGALDAGDTLVAAFAYDGLGRRVSKTVDNSADWDCTYHYYYDLAWRRIEMRDGSDQVLKQYVYGTRYVDNPVQIGVNTDPGEDDDAEETGTQDYCDDFYYPIQDANFNVVGVVNSAGDLVERYEYTPYGERTVFKNAGSSDATTSAPLYESQRVACGMQPAAWSLCDIGHQGLFLDKEIGLYDNRRRVLHPRFGRFMQRDPAGYADGMGLYEYVNSGPTGWVDPLGTKRRWPYWDVVETDSGKARRVKDCYVIVSIEHLGVAVQAPFQSHVDPDRLAAWFHLSCWGDYVNREQAGRGQERPGALKGIPRIRAPIGTYTGERPAMPKFLQDVNAQDPADPYYGDSDTTRNAGKGHTDQGFQRLLNIVKAKAEAQAKAFAEDCKCKCKQITAVFTGADYEPERPWARARDLFRQKYNKYKSNPRYRARANEAWQPDDVTGGRSWKKTFECYKNKAP
jgi:RHS repeat-associated protein